MNNWSITYLHCPTPKCRCASKMSLCYIMIAMSKGCWGRIHVLTRIIFKCSLCGHFACKCLAELTQYFEVVMISCTWWSAPRIAHFVMDLRIPSDSTVRLALSAHGESWWWLQSQSCLQGRHFCHQDISEVSRNHLYLPFDRFCHDIKDYSRGANINYCFLFPWNDSCREQFLLISQANKKKIKWLQSQQQKLAVIEKPNTYLQNWKTISFTKWFKKIVIYSSMAFSYIYDIYYCHFT